MSEQLVPEEHRRLLHRCIFFKLCLHKLGWQRSIFLSIFFVLPILVATLTAFSSSAEAQRVRKIRKVNPRSLSTMAIQDYEFSLSAELDRIVTNSVDPQLFDPMTLMELRAEKEIAEISWNREELDEEKTRPVAQKTLAIQTASTVIPAIKRSDLKDSFRIATAYYKSFTNLFKVSLQDSGSGMVVSKNKQGKNLLELNVDISPKSGFEPQIKIGELTRFRYDWAKGQTMLEFGTNF